MVRSAYNWAISKGIARTIRSFTRGSTLSRMYMNGTLRSWVHYIELRSGHGTQKEHMDIVGESVRLRFTYLPMIKDFISE